ncbi:MAG: sugar ABC transporter ATP-binding protein [Albidovulum sp.]|nr:sugar ABC transporter ATP-binding protein [Albidovulum sp.]MDE0529974.1 sugar ABC transporter ATP-binding protein [Albidovulum sp.]
MPEPVLRVEGISKRFGGVQALDSIDFEAHAGETHALIGENGAGKSTLVKILTGIHPADSGSIRIKGERRSLSRPQDAADAGVSAIHQEPSMFDELSVAENIFVASHPSTARFGLVSWPRMVRNAARLLQDLGTEIDPRKELGLLSVAERHIVSLARALSTDASIIIFDEPTAALSHSEIGRLFGIIGRLRRQGKAIVFISHKLDEVFRICDRYTVLRDGMLAGTGQTADTSEDDLIRAMVGRTLDDIYPKSKAAFGDVILQVQGFSHPTEFDNVGFQLRKGEILGFYGLVGAGRTEVMETLFGLKRRSGGEVRLRGTPLKLNSPSEAIDAGLAYVPEDRQNHGAILPMSISKNVSLPQIDKVSGSIFLNGSREDALVDEFGKNVAIKASSWSQLVEELSGGNQQKVVIGKWLATDPEVVILDEPTKGIDVGSKAAVHRTIGQLVKKGLAVILVSSELEEAIGISDRLVVMAQGRIVAEFSRPDFDREEIAAAATQQNPGVGGQKLSAEAPGR